MIVIIFLGVDGSIIEISIIIRDYEPLIAITSVNILTSDLSLPPFILLPSAIRVSIMDVGDDSSATISGHQNLSYLEIVIVSLKKTYLTPA